MSKQVIVQLSIILLFYLVALSQQQQTDQSSYRSLLSLNFNWKFYLGDFNLTQTNVTSNEYDDSDWQNVQVPHDFIVEGNFSPDAQKNLGYLPLSIGWYRLNFTLDENDQGKAIWIQFDGTFENTDVYLNGQLLGHHNSGYTSYQLRIDNFSTIFFGESQNVLAVRCDPTNPLAWWYSGGGIYRNVWLNKANYIHISPWGIFVQSNILSSIEKDESVEGRLKADANILISIDIVNQNQNLIQDQSQYQLTTTILEKNSQKIIAKFTNPQTFILQVSDSASFQQTLNLTKVNLWSLEDPFLYIAHIEVHDNNNQLIDYQDQTFGVRQIYFSPETGFYLNNQSVKIKGMANHENYCGVGTAVPDNLQFYRVQMLKSMGANAWRTAHNPHAVGLYIATDELGFLVWDENHFNNASDPSILDDVRSLVMRDRNHPSIIMWSICNEVLCNNFNATSAQIIKDIMHSLDPTRPVTAAQNGDFGDEFSQVLDIQGVNYNYNQYSEYHTQFPDKPMIGSETASSVFDRLITYTDPGNSYMWSYDDDPNSWAWLTSENAWQMAAEDQWISGAFIWTGFDYLGEPTPYSWPSASSHFGAIDFAGFPKDFYYYYQSVYFNDQNIVHIIPQNWNWQNTLNESWSSYEGFDSYPTENYGDNLENVQNVEQCQTECAERYGCIGFVYSHSYSICYFRNQPQNVLSANKVPNANCTLYINNTAQPVINIWVFSNCDYVKLFLNGNQIGNQQTVPQYQHASWNVSYVPGQLQAQGYFNNGTQCGEDLVKNVGTPYKVQLSLDFGQVLKPNKQDSALIRASILDNEGNLVINAQNFIEFSVIEGNGKIIGVGNGDPSSHEPNKASSRSAWNGLARCIVQASDQEETIILKATSEGLESSETQIQVSNNQQIIYERQYIQEHIQMMKQI